MEEVGRKDGKDKEGDESKKERRVERERGGKGAYVKGRIRKRER